MRLIAALREDLVDLGIVALCRLDAFVTQQIPHPLRRIAVAVQHDLAGEMALAVQIEGESADLPIAVDELGVEAFRCPMAHTVSGKQIGIGGIGADSSRDDRPYMLEIESDHLDC